jgi:hypothetical protein
VSPAQEVQGSIAVAQVMQAKPREACSPEEGQEAPSPKVLRPHGAAVLVGEHQQMIGDQLALLPHPVLVLQ